VPYALESPVGYSDDLLAEISIFMAADLVCYKVLRCTAPASFYEMCNQILADEYDDRLAISLSPSSISAWRIPIDVCYMNDPWRKLTN
jgi:hypothetical protein